AATAATPAASTGVALQVAAAPVGKSAAQTDAAPTEAELNETAAATAPWSATTAVLGTQLPVRQKTSVWGTSDAKTGKPDGSDESTQALSAQSNLAQVTTTARPQAANDLDEAPKSNGAAKASPAP